MVLGSMTGTSTEASASLLLMYTPAALSSCVAGRVPTVGTLGAFVSTTPV